MVFEFSRSSDGKFTLANIVHGERTTGGILHNNFVSNYTHLAFLREGHQKNVQAI